MFCLCWMSLFEVKRFLIALVGAIFYFYAGVLGKKLSQFDMVINDGTLAVQFNPG